MKCLEWECIECNQPFLRTEQSRWLCPACKASLLAELGAVTAAAGMFAAIDKAQASSKEPKQ